MGKTTQKVTKYPKRQEQGKISHKIIKKNHTNKGNSSSSGFAIQELSSQEAN